MGRKDLRSLGGLGGGGTGLGWRCRLPVNGHNSEGLGTWSDASG